MKQLTGTSVAFIIKYSKARKYKHSTIFTQINGFLIFFQGSARRLLVGGGAGRRSKDEAIPVREMDSVHYFVERRVCWWFLVRTHYGCPRKS